MDLYRLYQLMPGKDCGICGYGSCTTFLRQVIFGKEHLEKCAWLNKGAEIYGAVRDVTPSQTVVQALAVFKPCITDAEKVMAEIHLAHREVDYGYLDPAFCDVLPLYFETAKCSQSLGIGRIEYNGKEVLVSQNGKIVVRHADSEHDALEVCSLLSHIISGAVICPCLATGIECVSGLCSCTDCDIMEKLSSVHMGPEPLLEPYESAVLKTLAALWSGSLLDMKDIEPLKAQAVAVLTIRWEGLVLYALAHHLSSMQEAIKDAGNTPMSIMDIEKQHEITTFVEGALSGSYNPDEYHTKYHTIYSYLCGYDQPFFREVHKVVFYAVLIADIKNRFFR